MIEEDIDLSRFSEKTSSEKIYVTSLYLHEIKNEILLDYKGNFELEKSMDIGHVEHKTDNRFKNMDDFENYINAVDNHFDREDVTSFVYVYKLKTSHFKVVKRNAYAKGVIYMKEIVDYRGHNCYIPPSGMSFIKCNI